MDICTWEKLKGKYETSCGHKPVSHGRGWVYCPFCGKLVMLSRINYQKRYAKAHKKERQAYYKAYYRGKK